MTLLYQALEDKLIGIKNIVMKHSNTSDFSGMYDEIKNIIIIFLSLYLGDER